MSITRTGKRACCLATARARQCWEQWNGNRGILASKIKSDGRYEEQLFSPGGGTRRRPTAETLAAGDHFFKMKGNELFKVAVRSMAEISREVLDKAGLEGRRRRSLHSAPGESTNHRSRGRSIECGYVEGLFEHRGPWQHFGGVDTDCARRMCRSRASEGRRSGVDGFVWRRRDLGRRVDAMVRTLPIVDCQLPIGTRRVGMLQFELNNIG